MLYAGLLTVRIATTNPWRFSLNAPWSYWCLSLTACRSNENSNWFILSLISWANISRALLERPVIASGSHSVYDLQCLERCTVFNFLWVRTIHFAMLFKWLRINSAFTINTRCICYSRPILLEWRGTPLLLTAVYFNKSVDVCVNIFLQFMSISALSAAYCYLLYWTSFY